MAAILVIALVVALGSAVVPRLVATRPRLIEQMIRFISSVFIVLIAIRGVYFIVLSLPDSIGSEIGSQLIHLETVAVSAAPSLPQSEISTVSVRR